MESVRSQVSVSASSDMDSLHNMKNAGVQNMYPTHSSAYSSNVKRAGGYVDGLLLKDSGLSLALSQASILHKSGSLFQLISQTEILLQCYLLG